MDLFFIGKKIVTCIDIFCGCASLEIYAKFADSSYKLFIIFVGQNNRYILLEAILFEDLRFYKGYDFINTNYSIPKTQTQDL